MSLLPIHMKVPSKDKTILSTLIRVDATASQSLRSFFETELKPRAPPPVGELHKVQAMLNGVPP
jgi:hypothetical protein